MTALGRVVVVLGAGALILLKSVTVPAPDDWERAAREGVIDPLFPRILRGRGPAGADTPGPRVRVVNLRSWQVPAER